MSKPKQKRPTHKPDLIGEVDRSISWLMVALAGVLPLLVRTTTIDFTAPLIISRMANTGPQSDSFSYYKWIFLMIITAAVIFFMLLKILAYNYEIKASYINIPVLVLVVFLVGSCLGAEYKTLALVGLYNQHEGALTWLCYLALFFAAANTIVKERFIRGLVWALGILTVVNTTIIMAGFFGYNLLQFSLLRILTLPSGMQNYGAGKISNTFGNPNYGSGFAAALFALFITLMLLHSGLKQRLLYAAGSILAFVMLMGSFSSSGFVTVLIVSPLIVAAALLSPERKRSLLAGGGIVLLCAAVFLIMNSYNPSVGRESVGFFMSIFDLDSLNQDETSSAPAAGTSQAAALNYAGPGTLALRTTDTVSRGNISRGEAPVENLDLPAPGFAPGTGRFYIWEETWKIIRDRPWLGYGQGTLTYYFPQNDINKVASLWEYDLVVTKTHNMYLGMAFGSGVPASLALLILLLMYFYYSGRCLIKSGYGRITAYQAAFYLFCTAMAVQWLFNDVVVETGAIFWVLLGLGVSLTRELDLQSANSR